ncbi:MAG: cupredoxin domain-containing protein [Actinomycetota bacterium]|nr:cupredoxin domain-containing protein [Actinomycetota bacterium]
MRGILGRAGAVLAAGVLAAGLASCGDGEDRPSPGASASGSGTGTGSGSHAGEHGGEAKSFPESEANTVVRATLRDFAFEGVGSTVKGPRVYFEATNQGPSEHELVVMDEAGKELGEIEAFDKGKESKPLALELQPGRYKATCLVKLGDKTHGDLGMEASFTVE